VGVKAAAGGALLLLPLAVLAVHDEYGLASLTLANDPAAARKELWRPQPHADDGSSALDDVCFTPHHLVCRCVHGRVSVWHLSCAPALIASWRVHDASTLPALQRNRLRIACTPDGRLVACGEVSWVHAWP